MVASFRLEDYTIFIGGCSGVVPERGWYRGVWCKEEACSLSGTYGRYVVIRNRPESFILSVMIQIRFKLRVRMLPATHMSFYQKSIRFKALRA